MARRQTRRRKEKKNVEVGVAHIQSTFNNTVITITDKNGNAISWSTAGAQGFKGSRKSTPFAAQMAADQAAKEAMEHGMRQVECLVKGPGSAGRGFGGQHDQRCDAHSPQRLPPAQKKKSLGGKINGKIHWCCLPPVPPGRHEALSERRPLLF